MARHLIVILSALMFVPGFLAAQTAKEISLPGGAKMGFVIIGPGTFRMGSPKSEKGRYEHEGPRHKVRIPRNPIGPNIGSLMNETKILKPLMHR